MKNCFFKIIIIISISLLISMQGFCDTIKFNNSYVSDSAELIDQTYAPVLNDILKNFKKDTGVDFIVVTVENQNEEKRFRELEEQILTKYPINIDNYIMIIYSKYPFERYISRSDNLKDIIPNTMIRALNIELWIEKQIGGIGYRGRNTRQPNDNANQKNYRINFMTAGTNIYSTVLALADTIAQEYGKELYYRNDLYIMGLLVEGEYSKIPHTNPGLQFIRRYDLYPVIIIIIIGIIPYYIRRVLRKIFGKREPDSQQRLIDFINARIKK